MLEKDPRSDFKTSRGLRVLAFSLVAAIILTSLLVVTVRFLWDEFLRHIPVLKDLTGGAPYSPQPLIILPAMGLITALIGKMLWDLAQGRVVSPRRR